MLGRTGIFLTDGVQSGTDQPVTLRGNNPKQNVSEVCSFSLKCDLEKGRERKEMADLC